MGREMPPPQIAFPRGHLDLRPTRVHTPETTAYQCSAVLAQFMVV